jgi:hypothetical protein
VLNSATLAALLTTAKWGDRRLGATENVDRANDRVWTITGNNVNIGGDLARRTVTIVIDPGIPHPERRTGFTIADLEGHVRDHRGQILHALLVLVRAWVAAGRPTGGRAGSDGYARWIEMVGGILANAGMPGVFDHRDTQLDIGGDDDEWGELLAAIEGVFGADAWTVKELLGKFQTREE